MKISVFLLRMLLIISICCLPSAAQDYTQFSLPEGAKARFGKGKLGEVRFSPDGRRLAVSSSVGIWFYDPDTGKALDLLPQTNCASTFAFAYSPDGTIIARAVNNSSVQLWNVTTKRRIGTFTKYGREITAIAYALDGTTIVSGNSDGAARVWDTTTMQRIGTLRGYHTSGVTSVTYSPDGTTIATGGSTGAGWRNNEDNTVQLWDAFTGKRKIKLTGHTKRITAIAYSPDGNTIATASWDTTVRLWDSANGKHKTTLKHTQGINALLPWERYNNAVNVIVYSPDGNTIATGTRKGKVCLWDTRTMKRKTTLTGHTSRVTSIAYSPDGNTIATASGRWHGDNTVRLWNAQTGKTKATIITHNNITLFAYSPDGNTIAIGESESFQLRDARTGKHKTTITIRGTPIAYCPEGNTIATDENWNDTVRLWNAKTGKPKATLRHTNLIHLLLTDREYDISSVVFSPDGNTLVTVGEYYTHNEGTIYLWHVRTGKRKVIHEGESYESRVVFLPDGRTIASADFGGKIRLWNLVTGELEATITSKHTGGIKSLACAPDGNTIATGGGNDNIVRLWNINTRKNNITLTGHRGAVTAIAYSPDGNTIATGSVDRTIRLWNADTGKHETTFTAYATVTSIIYSPDGRTLASRNRAGTGLLWEIKQ